MKKLFIGLALFGVLFACACGNGTAAETPQTTTEATTATTTSESTKENTPTPTPTPKPTLTPTKAPTKAPTRTPTPTPKPSNSGSGWGLCNTCHKRQATHGVFCDECYYDEKQKLWNNGISDTELDMWANGYGWYDDDYYY